MANKHIFIELHEIDYNFLFNQSIDFQFVNRGKPPKSPKSTPWKGICNSRYVCVCAVVTRPKIEAGKHKAQQMDLFDRNCTAGKLAGKFFPVRFPKNANAIVKLGN